MPHESRIKSDPDEREPDVFARNAYGRYAGMGLTFALTILAFGWIGWWLDGILGTLPLFLITGILAGFGAGLISMIKRVPPARGRRNHPSSDFQDGSDSSSSSDSSDSSDTSDSPAERQ